MQKMGNKFIRIYIIILYSTSTFIILILSYPNNIERILDLLLRINKIKIVSEYPNHVEELIPHLPEQTAPEERRSSEEIAQGLFLIRKPISVKKYVKKNIIQNNSIKDLKKGKDQPNLIKLRVISLAKEDNIFTIYIKFENKIIRLYANNGWSNTDSWKFLYIKKEKAYFSYRNSSYFAKLLY